MKNECIKFYTGKKVGEKKQISDGKQQGNGIERKE